MDLEIVGCRVASPLGGACSSYLVRGDGASVLLDCGPGALERLWTSGALVELDAIVISHLHQDHVLDLVPLSNEITREALADAGRATPLTVHVPSGRGPEVLRALAVALGDDAGRFERSFDLREYDDRDEVRAGALRLSFAPTGHADPCFAARVTDGDGRSLVYSADSPPSQTLEEHARGTDLLLVEATRVEPSEELTRHGHMTGEQAAQLAARAGTGRLVLTHLSPWMDGHDEENLRRARALFPGRVDLAVEGLVVPATRAG